MESELWDVGVREAGISAARAKGRRQPRPVTGGTAVAGSHMAASSLTGVSKPCGAGLLAVEGTGPSTFVA